MEKGYRYYSHYSDTNCWHTAWELEFVAIGVLDSIKQSAASFFGRNLVLFPKSLVGAGFC